MKSKWLKLACIGLATCVALPFAAACSPEQALSNEDRALKITSGDFDGVFNPFFATSAYDSTIVGQTQISMIGADDEGVNVTYGVDEPVVTLDYKETMYTASGAETPDGNQADKTVYQFVIKNGILFSDGVPLTAHDVLFNIYMYLDPNYTGSNTMYSTDIQGLQAYLAQDPQADEDSLSAMNTTFNTMANLRIEAIIRYCSVSGYTEQQKQDAIDQYNNFRRGVFEDYDASNGTDFADSYDAYDVGSADDESNSILSDLKKIREQFRTDLESTYNGIDMTSYQNEYSFDSNKPWQAFFYETGLIERQYKPGANNVPIYDKDSNGKYIMNWANISADYTAASEISKEEAIEYVYNYYSRENSANQSGIIDILTMFTTGTTMSTVFAGDDKEMYYDAIGMAVKNISGIKIKDASEFNGSTQYAAGEYDMLEITINGVDPKAKWNFAFTVAPMHYYSTPELTAAAMADEDYSEHFGVEFSSNTFMNFVKSRNSVPVGAGVYQASTQNDQTFKWETDANGNQTADSSASLQTVADGFRSSGIVYLLRNDYFYTTGGNIEEVYNAKIKHLNYQETSTINMVTSIVNDQVDISDPSASIENVSAVNQQSKLTTVTIETSGYGYIGFNAKFINDIDVRRGLMTVMNVGLVKAYYGDLAYELYRPFSTTSWVYEANSKAGLDKWNPKAYYPYDETGVAAGEYFTDAGYTRTANGWVNSAGEVLEFTFTIAGETDDHPANPVFLNAVAVLNKIGVKATIVTDGRALYKLASGDLEIWGAAWQSSLDPDMYQVYHKDSRATSVLNWGYDYLITQNKASAEEIKIINDLSDLIDEGREYLDEGQRAKVYREAADKVMELAIELPLYQRYDIYVYNNQVLDENSLYPEPTAYMGPFSEIWKVSYKGN